MVSKQPQVRRKSNRFSLMTTKTILLATVGGQPQVVTFALDALLARQESIGEVVALHVMKQASHQSITKLGQEFAEGRYLHSGQPCRFRSLPLNVSGRWLEDIQDEFAAEAVLQQVRTLLADLKQQGYRLHLCVAGGRRIISFMLLSAATLLCDHHDRVWHLYTPDTIRQQAAGGSLMHVPPSAGVQLIQVPLVPWGAWFPGLRAMAQTPQEAITAQMGWLSAGHEEHCQQVYAQLTDRERDALVEFGRGRTPQEVAETLGVKLSTVNTYKTKILGECRTVWGLTDDTRVDYRFLSERFAPFLRRLGKL